jgi:hypothetical protein
LIVEDEVRDKTQSMKLTKAYVCGLVLAGLPLWLAAAENSKAAKFVGQWTNKDFETSDTTPIHVRIDKNRILVHAWGRCHPIECDWGETNATLHGETLSVTWNKSFAAKTQEISLLLDGTMQLKTHVVYKEKGREGQVRDSKSVFVKGLVHNWTDPKLIN